MPGLLLAVLLAAQPAPAGRAGHGGAGADRELLRREGRRGRRPRPGRRRPERERRRPRDHVLQAGPAAPLGRRDRGHERRARLDLPAERGRGRDGADRPAAGGHALRAVGERRPADQARRLHRGPRGGRRRRCAWSPRRAATTCSTRSRRPRRISRSSRARGTARPSSPSRSTGPELSYRDKFRAVEEAQKNAELFLAVQIDSSEADFDTRSNLSYTLDHLAVASGGRYEMVLSAMAHGRGAAQAVLGAAGGLPRRVRDGARPQEAQARAHGGPARRRGWWCRRARRASCRSPDGQAHERMRRMIKTLVLTGAVAAALAAPAPARPQARPQTPTFGAGIEIINLSLSVTDARNNFVTDLEQKDFAVFEDGIRQELSLFTHENLPISMVADDRHLGLDGGEARDGAGGRDPLHEDAAAAGPGAGRPVQRPLDDAAALHERPGRARGGDQADRGLGPDGAAQLALRRAQGPDEGQEGGRAAPARDRAALGRRGHGVARHRRPGARAGAQERDQHLRDQPARRTARRTARARPSARPSTW